MLRPSLLFAGFILAANASIAQQQHPGLFSLLDTHYARVTGFQQSVPLARDGAHDAEKIYEFKVDKEHRVVYGYVSPSILPSEKNTWTYVEFYYNDKGLLIRQVIAQTSERKPKVDHAGAGHSKKYSDRMISTFQYDQNGNETRYVFWNTADGMGEATVFETSYNEKGMPVQREYCTTINGNVYRVPVAAWTYDDSGRILSVKHISRTNEKDFTLIKYSYNPDGSCTQKRYEDYSPTSAPWVFAVENFEYLPNGTCKMISRRSSDDSVIVRHVITNSVETERHEYSSVDTRLFFRQLPVNQKAVSKSEREENQTLISEESIAINDLGFITEIISKDYQTGKQLTRKTEYR